MSAGRVGADRAVTAAAAAFVGLVPFGWTILPANVQIGDLLLPVLLVALVAAGWRYRYHPLDVAIAVFLITSAISAPGSLSPQTSWLAVVKEAYLACVYLAVSGAASMVGSDRLSRWLTGSAAALAAASLAAAAIFVVSGIVWRLLGEPMVLPYLGAVFRARGTLYTPELFGNLLTFVAPLALFFALRPGADRKWSLAAAAVVAAELITFSKSIGGCAVALVTARWPAWRGRPWLKVTAASAAALLVVAFNVAAAIAIRRIEVSFGTNPSIAAPSYGYVRPGGADTLDVRVSYNPMSYFLVKKVGWSAFLRRPLTGIGLSAFPFESGRAFDEGRLPLSYQRFDAHSTPLGRLAETGAIGFAGLVAMVAVLWRTGFAAAGGGSDALAWALLAGCLGLFVNSLNVDMMHFRFFWLGMGLVRARSIEQRAPAPLAAAR